MGKTSLKERKKELATHLCRIMGNSSVHHHFLLSNLTDPDEEFEKIRLEISTAAKRMNHWGERVPLTWIRLEYEVAIQRHDGKNFIGLSDMVRMAKHPKINIQDKDEVLRFLRFQHESGNIIYFDDIPDLIILHPQWVADAFRCLVADEICDKLQHRSDWKTCVQNTQMHYDLINKLFKSNCGNQFFEQAENLLILMEKIDVLFKISKTGLYIIPSRIPSVSFDKVCQQIGVDESICKRTSWLCLKFTFLPPAFFYHMYVYLLGEYQPTKMENAKQSMALFRELCVFDIDKSKTKLLITMSTDTIALQLLSFSKEEEFGIVCSNIRKVILRKAELIRQKYNFKILYELHFKCNNGNYYEDTMPYQDLKSSPLYYCKQHVTQHQSVNTYMPWMMNKNQVSLAIIYSGFQM